MIWTSLIPSKKQFKSLLKGSTPSNSATLKKVHMTPEIINSKWEKAIKIMSSGRNSNNHPLSRSLNNRMLNLSHTKAKVDIVALHEASILQKEDIITTLFKGKTKIKKHLTKSKSESLNTIKLKHLLESLSGEQTQWLNFFLLSEYEDIDFFNNKVKIGNQWRKMSKEMGKFLRKNILDVSATEIEFFIQKLSVIFAPMKPETIVWSVEPTDFVIQSTGTTWNSCHATHVTRDGLSSNYHPWISQSLDNVSTIAYVVDPITGLLKSRMAVYVNMKTKEAVIGRAYPSSGNPYQPLLEFIQYKLKAEGITLKGSYHLGNILPNVFTKITSGRKTFAGYGDIARFNTTSKQDYNTVYGYDHNLLRRILCK